MSRTFWVMVGAVGGVLAYRRGMRAVARARELGPIGTAQVAAQATSTLAGRTANGLGHLQDLKARREGRLLTGSVQPAPAPPEGWVRLPERGEPSGPSLSSQSRPSSAMPPGTMPQEAR